MPKPKGVATSTTLHRLMLQFKQLLTFIDRTNLFGCDNTQYGIIKNQFENVQHLSYGFLKASIKIHNTGFAENKS